MHLGTTMYMLGAVLYLLCFNVLDGTPEDNMHAIWTDINQFYTDHRVVTQISNLKILSWPWPWPTPKAEEQRCRDQRLGGSIGTCVAYTHQRIQCRESQMDHHNVAASNNCPTYIAWPQWGYFCSQNKQHLTLLKLYIKSLWCGPMLPIILMRQIWTYGTQ